MNVLIECRGLGVVRGRRQLVEGFDFALAPGEVVGVVGPNGAGKSSLLATLAGLLPRGAGEVLLDGCSLERMPRRRIACRLGFLPQETDDPYPATVLETALIGRHPHIGFWRWESAADVAKARAALRRVGLAAAAARSVATLSGGERRRLAIATLLAQAPQVYLLDEPLETLDFAYQARLLKLLRRLARFTGIAVMMSLHDLSLAARHAHRVILLDGRGTATAGPPDVVLGAERIAAVYGCPVRVLRVEGWPFYLVG
ncbi:MAG: ABC transporter ATP-binding protein [Gammaproteobacteria bacterium]